MKKFIITNLLAIVSLPLLACAGGGTINYYLFNLYEINDFQNRVEEICKNNWKVYMGLPESEWFWFDEDKITQVAQQKNDALMQSYVRELARYLKCCSDVANDHWDYPTKEQLAQRKATLESIRTYAGTKLRTKLRSQHALLYMRANMLLQRHAENVQFWERAASEYIETVYKDMMRNIYAGALYKTNREAQAADIFVEQGDYKSLMTIFYKRRSFAAIQNVYQQDPRARVLPFLLQDFVNNAQEADDAVKHQSLGGKLFIRDISKAEAQQMIQLCQRAVSERRTDVPAMWQTAKAWLEFMFGNQQQALNDIRLAGDYEGTQRMHDCARIIRFYIEASLRQPDTEFNNWAGGELRWLYNKGNRTPSADNCPYYNDAYARITKQVLAEKYKARHGEMTAAIYKAANSWEYEELIDTASIANLQKYFSYINGTPKTEMDRFLQEVIRKQTKEADADNRINDLIGTKYLRLCQWQEAEQWLNKVPVSYYQERGYASYAALRKTTIEPWITRQWLSDAQLYGDQKPTLRENPKLTFAQTMQKLEGELNVLKGKARQQRCYDLAVRYAQVNFSGDCWFIMRDSKSPGWDKVRVNETDLAARALELLREASKTSDESLKERALFALAYGELQPESLWFEEKWNTETGRYDHLNRPESSQWKAFAQLAAFEKKNSAGQSRYVTLCDEYDVFKKAFK